MTASDKEEHGNVNILLSFCRHCGEDYAGLMPRKYRLLNEKFNMEIPKSDVSFNYYQITSDVVIIVEICYGHWIINITLNSNKVLISVIFIFKEFLFF